MLNTIGEIRKVCPDVIRGRTLSEAGSKTAKLDPKIRELISLAVAVTVRCDGCITTHTDAAIGHERRMHSRQSSPEEELQWQTTTRCVNMCSTF